VRYVVALLVALAVIVPAAAAERTSMSFPLKLTDPVTEQKVGLKPDGALLHLVFVATWCPPCMEEMPDLAEIEARWGGSGYRLVLVAVPTRQSPERLREFLATDDPPGTLLLDHANAAIRASGTSDIPAHVLVAADGRVIHRSESLDAGVEQAVATYMEARARGRY
jgi:thiol-disulfide isomerase/thioredoxin